MSLLTTLFSNAEGELKKIEGFIVSPTLETDAEDVAILVEKAAPIVAKIAAMVPNKTVQEVAAAYATYGLTTATGIADNSESIGNALLNLGTLLLKNLSPNSTVTKLNTAVQLAVLGMAKPAAQ